MAITSIVEARKILGVSFKANMQDVRKQYRTLAMLHHPDRDGGNAEAFHQCKEAYEVLSAHLQKFGDSNFDENSDRLFANNLTINISVSELFNGTVKDVRLDDKNSTSIEIPAGCLPNTIFEILHAKNEEIYRVRLKIEDKTFDRVNWPYDTVYQLKGDVNMSLALSPFVMIIGGWINVKMVDGGNAKVYVPPGVSERSILKVKGRGFWSDPSDLGTTEKVSPRGDCFISIRADFKKLSEYDEGEISSFYQHIESLWREKDNIDKEIT